MLGSDSEADDALQEAWLKLTRADADQVENVGGWLTTIVGRGKITTIELVMDPARLAALDVEIEPR
jgi:DNA-directed RNA polymerase specialized sigma24 family protein